MAVQTAYTLGVESHSFVERQLVPLYSAGLAHQQLLWAHEGPWDVPCCRCHTFAQYLVAQAMVQLNRCGPDAPSVGQGKGPSCC